VGSIEVSYSDRLAHYSELLGRLRLRCRRTIPFCGGTTISGKETADDDTDRDPPYFSVGMFDRTDG
jgi:hypothetical protein